MTPNRISIVTYVIAAGCFAYVAYVYAFQKKQLTESLIYIALCASQVFLAVRSIKKEIALLNAEIENDKKKLKKKQ